jgi:phosphoesterase RecJ-like protein
LGPILEGSTADKILIDHHLSPDRDKFSLVFSETQISSASELLYHILKMLPPVNNIPGRLPMESRIALMTGMTTDTNNFANSVYPSTFSMASELIETGVDRNMILYNIYNRFKESRVRLQGHILKDLMKITDDGVAYIVLNRQTMDEYDVQEGDTEGFVNMPLSIEKVVMSIMLKEDNDRVRVSIRSKKGYSANACAREFFNGGGHENASGGRLFIGTDIESIDDAPGYIERNTHSFMKRYNG